MTSALRLDASDARPLWRQLEELLAQQIASGSLAPGAPIPSVREMALRLRVNPATVVKAYQRLVEQGLLESRRGDGTYVAGAPPALRASERRRRLAEAATRLATVCSTLGAAREEAHAALDAALDGFANGLKERR